LREYPDWAAVVQPGRLKEAGRIEYSRIVVSTSKSPVAAQTMIVYGAGPPT